MSQTSHHADIYARYTVALIGEPQASGAEAVFDAAATNGLLAITAWESGQPWATKHLPSARALIKSLQQQPVSPSAIDAQTLNRLEQAIVKAQQPRHGGGPDGVLGKSDIAALVALDEHPALGRLSDARADASWTAGGVADIAEQVRAFEYLSLLDDDEVDRRVRDAVAASAHYDPSDPGPSLGYCDVCGHESLVPTGTDAMGYGNTQGVCFVCSYRRSQHAADEQDFADHWEMTWKHY